MIKGEIWKCNDGSLAIIREESIEDPISSRYGIKMIGLVHLREWNDKYGSKFWILELLPNELNQLKSKMYVDCANLINASSNCLISFVGYVEDDFIARIVETNETFNNYVNNTMQNRRFDPRVVQKYDYDVALSFAGEDRALAESIASVLKESRIRVFYDEYEKTNLWGKDLVQHLDEVYRNKAKYCVVFISQYYATKIWTNHELKSALARSISQNEEYILPLKLDETELPGVRPTMGYLSIKGISEAKVVCESIISKLKNKNLINYAEFSAKWLENVLEINRLWELDCLAFCIDKRFVLDDEGWENRIGISYGINSTSPRTGFLAPEEQEGNNVFGLHCIATKNCKLCLTDRWVTSKQADNYDQLEDAIREMYAVLAAISDNDYRVFVKHAGSTEVFDTSDRYLLDEFKVSTEIG